MVKLPWYFKLAFIFCLPAAVLAEDLPTYSVTSEYGKLTLTAEPCKAHEWLKEWEVARWMWKGKPYEACWRVQSDGTQQLVVVVDSNGEVTTFHPGQFVQDKTI